jgi:PA14 domain/Right handed beta helix region
MGRVRSHSADRQAAASSDKLAAMGAMRIGIVASLLCVSGGREAFPQGPTVELRPGLVITRSVRVVPRTYRLPAPKSLDSSVITIRGDDITVDFRGATLAGAPVGADPDAAGGVGVRIDGGRNIRIVNARIRGYKVGIVARGTRGLALIDNDLSDNWKPRLFSVVEHESLTDWLSYHRNEKDEWLRSGAAVYLADVRGGEIRGNRVERGMNGVLLVRSDSLRLWNNIIAFNSGVGFGLQERFAIDASGSVGLGPGTDTLRTISDDGVRVWVDGRLVIDSWTPHESRVDNVALGPGRHDIRVQYYQLRGWTELRLEILRGVHRSAGSPGPH